MLSSIVATLGASSSSAPASGADERSGGGSIGCLSDDERLMKEQQGAQVLTDVTRWRLRIIVERKRRDVLSISYVSHAIME